MRISPPASQFSIILIIIILLFSLLFGNIISSTSGLFFIAVILSIILLVVTFANTEIGLFIVIFSMLLSPEIIVGQIPGRDIVIRFDDVLLLIITFGWFAKTAINKELSLFKRKPFNIPIIIYLLICFLSTIRGVVLGYVVLEKGAFYLIRYTEYFVLYILVANHIHDKEQIKKFLYAIFVVCAIVSLIGIAQIPLGGRVTAPFEGEAGEPNTFGGYLLFILCLAIGVVLQKIPGQLKLSLSVLVGLGIFPFFYTLSRASYLAAVFSVITFLILSKRRVAVVSMLFMIIFIGVILQPERISSRIKYTFEGQQYRTARIGNIYFDPSSSERIYALQDAIEKWKQNPFLGRGVTGFTFIDGQYTRTLPELGIIGLLAFLWLLWVILKHSYKIFSRLDDGLFKGLALGYIAGYIGLLIHSLTANTFIILRIMEPFWFVTGLIVSLEFLKEEPFKINYADDK